MGLDHNDLLSDGDEELRADAMEKSDSLQADDTLGDADDEGPGDDLDSDLEELALPDGADIVLDNKDLQEDAP